MFKSKVWIFILLAAAALVLQLIVSQGRLGGLCCPPRSGPDLLTGYSSGSAPPSSR